MRFSSRDYEDETKVVSESVLLWIRVNNQIRQEIVYSIRLIDLYLQDPMLQFSELTEDELRIFTS